MVLFQALEEFLLILSYPFSGLLSLFLPHTKVRNEKNKGCIVIVRRWLTRHALYVIWKYYLEKRGFRVYLLNFPLQHGDFRKSGKKLKTYIDNRNLSNITLVGISAGGLTALSYLENNNGWQKVNKFISVGTPFFGSPLMYFLFIIKGARELFPNSKFINDLFSKEIKNKDKIFCIQAKYDEFISSKSSFIKGSRKIIINIFGHNKLHMNSIKTYQTISLLAQD